MTFLHKPLLYLIFVSLHCDLRVVPAQLGSSDQLKEAFTAVHNIFNEYHITDREMT